MSGKDIEGWGCLGIVSDMGPEEVAQAQKQSNLLDRGGLQGLLNGLEVVSSG